MLQSPAFRGLHSNDPYDFYWVVFGRDTAVYLLIMTELFANLIVMPLLDVTFAIGLPHVLLPSLCLFFLSSAVMVLFLHLLTRYE